jgi:hypothetical protein
MALARHSIHQKAGEAFKKERLLAYKTAAEQAALRTSPPVPFASGGSLLAVGRRAVPDFRAEYLQTLAHKSG